ncbi:unnamed protein product, partial [Vitis vinifera]|uniref:Uncharacterized protein n=1 Tax=Vitis vinifera TaxID=29760 RepID=D7U5S1_VITVI
MIIFGSITLEIGLMMQTFQTSVSLHQFFLASSQ